MTIAAMAGGLHPGPTRARRPDAGPCTGLRTSFNAAGLPAAFFIPACRRDGALRSF